MHAGIEDKSLFMNKIFAKIQGIKTGEKDRVLARELLVL